MSNTVTASAATQATSIAGRRFTSCVTSSMNAIAVNGARIVPPSIAPMPSAAQTPGSPPGSQGPTTSTPPDVPDPSAIAQITALVISRPSRNVPINRAFRRSRITSYPTPSARGYSKPPNPTTTPPIAGHHIQWIGSLPKKSSDAYTSRVRRPDPKPAISPSASALKSARGARGKCPLVANPGPAPISGTRSAPATAAAAATGMNLRGFHSNSSSSTASSTAATGVAKIADMPPAAPATSNVLRSAADM